MIREVDQWQQFALAYYLQHPLPVILGQVETGRVVAAGVQQDHVTLGRFVERRQHAVDVETVVAAHVRVVADLDLGCRKNRFVDRPGRVAQPHATPWQALGDKVRAQAQSPGAARSLGGAGALCADQLRVGTQHQLIDRFAERRFAVTTDVGLGGLAVHQALLGKFHRLENRRQALGVFIDTHAQIELARVRVLRVGLHQAQNRVARHSTDGVEMHYLRPSASFATSSVRAAMMKSLRCRPLIEWLHQVTVTLPHSVSRPG
ncbi:hypothetical protein D3C71_1278550 [compost metagenome]